MIRLLLNDDVRFLMAAQGKQVADSKYRLDVICSTRVDNVRVLVCTDSRRLHVIENYQDIPEGIYTTIEDKKNKLFILEPIDARFPDIGIVLNSAANTTGQVDWDYPGDKKGATLNFSTTIARFFRAFMGFMDIALLKDLGEDSFDAWFSNENAPCYFVNHSKVAVIMPLRY